MYSNNGWEWRVDSVVTFENTGDSKNFHKKFYGGTGYPYSGGINTKEPADIVVIGDSHARHYMEGLYKIFAKPNNLALYNSSGTSCIMLPNFTRTTKGHDWDTLCKKGLNNGLKYLINGNKNSILIISQSWLTQIKLAGILNKSKKQKNISVDDVLEGIYRLKKIIGTKKLIVIGNVPGSEHNLYDIFSRPRPIFFTTFNPNNYIKTKPKENILEFNKKLKEASLKTKSFIFLDPHDILCNGGFCDNLDIEKHLLYSDTSHLSKYGSIKVIEGFLPDLERVYYEQK